MNASVLVDVVLLGGTPGKYTYDVPEGLQAELSPGRRVVVPFGNRRRTGVVVGPASAAPAGPLKSVDSVLDDGPLLLPEVLRLVSWAADYYDAPLSHAFKAALPPGADAEEKRRPELSEAGRIALAGNSISGPLRRTLTAVENGFFESLPASTLNRLVKEGLLQMRSQMSDGASTPLVEWVLRSADTAVIPARYSVQHAVWQLLLTRPQMPLEALQASVVNARDAVRRLEKRGLVRLEHRPFTPETSGAFQVGAEPTTPTEEQQAVLEELERAIGQEPKTFLLEGVTGSGKTEVYLRLIQKARSLGRTALVLVPEIALTPQMSTRFRARFGPEVAVLHSGLSERDRRAEWYRVKRGEAPIVVGARSAVYAPLERPAVVIVDEEHDPSFKQGEGLRYNGRDLAVMRARFSGALCVLGSATPSLESVLNARRGRYGHLRLRSRVDSRPMPEVQLVDLRGRAKDKAVDGILPSGLLSPELLFALKETQDRGEQSILFLNRRGHSTALLCRDCGTVHKCRSCAVSMTWHEKRARLVCHYCGARELVLEVCDHCGSTRLLLAGAGTEKLEEELALALPGARIARLDRDTASTSDKLEALLGRFSRHEIDVLVGTQMVAKGHDFPGVTLVGVLMADAGLHQPDFRASERTAQLLTQVAGRAGRGLKPGRVFVQTFAPDMPAVNVVLRHDYGAFAEAELKERESAGYPPHVRACLIRIDGEREEEAARISSVLARSMAPKVGDGYEVVGPAPCALSRLRNRSRFQILVKAGKHSDLRLALSRLRQSEHRVPSTVRVVVDVDPVDML